MRKFLFLSFYLLLAAISVACEDDSSSDNSTSEIIKVNQFIWDVMDEVYLWEAQMPRNIDLKKETVPSEYLEKLLYTDDEWSFVTDDVEGLLDSFEGKEKTFGYSLIFGQFSDTKDYFAIVEYVNPGTPASEAALKRGDIIIKVNGSNISASNYMNLFYGTSITITKGVYTENGIAEGTNVSMTSRELTINPILLNKILTVDGKKIGYIVYNQFITDYNDQLTTIFQEFKSQQVSDVVVDLRFNPGGYVDAAIHLCSILAPQSAISTPSVLIQKQWNTLYQDYWTKNNNTGQLQSTFNKNVAVNMNLNKVYFLTSESSASASELTIVGLRPYMQVITIGDDTSGKYTASSTFQPTINENGDLDPDIKNWAIQPIIFKYANAAGYTDFKDGIAPTHEVDEIIIAASVPQLGDQSEPLLAAAISLITGNATKSAIIDQKTNWNRIDQASSKYQKQKQILLVPNPLAQ